MTENKSLLSNGLGMVTRNKRYVVWFFLLNLLLGVFGADAFRKVAHSILDNSQLSTRLVHGFDFPVLIELMARPEFGPAESPTSPTLHFAFVFFFATALLLPGVLAGYASTYRLPRNEFFRACGQNLWRFIRLLLIAGIVMGTATAALFGLHGVLETKAADSTNELLVFEVQMAGLAIIFLIMTIFRIWFDLAQADIVLSDQNSVHKSIGAAFGHTFRSLGRLLVTYVVITLVAAVILIGGLLAWLKFVAPESIIGAFLLSQLILLLLLVPRFWQRGVAVSYWQQKMVAPVYVPVQPTIPEPLPAPVVTEPAPPPTIPGTPVAEGA